MGYRLSCLSVYGLITFALRNRTSEFFVQENCIFFKEEQSVIFTLFDRILMSFRSQIFKKQFFLISLFLGVYVTKCPSFRLPRDSGIDRLYDVC